MKVGINHGFSLYHSLSVLDPQQKQRNGSIKSSYSLGSICIIVKLSSKCAEGAQNIYSASIQGKILR